MGWLFYTVIIKCKNCGKTCNVKIKKGVSVAEAIEGETIKCDNCFCIIKPEEYSTQWMK